MSHTSQLTRDWIFNNEMNFIPFGGSPTKIAGGYPPNSLDCNPIEKIFGILDHVVALRLPKTIVELKEIVEDEWNKISLKKIQRTISKLPQVLKRILDLKGDCD